MIVKLAMIIESFTDLLIRKKRQNDDECIPETYFDEECNFCFCGPNKERLCTDRDCSEEEDDDEEEEDAFKRKKREEEEDEEEEEDCEPGSYFDRDCNFCYCGPNREALCTRKACSKFRK
ncbi:hypothetical protein SK128_026892 [Halocaridina rubra]|uniref:Protease inhibitor n=1 Tax=Halocaridina rubra TaxID=373956 RepID=A0AAN8ZYA5_HALRR